MTRRQQRNLHGGMKAMWKIYLAAAITFVFIGNAVAEEVTISKSVLGCAALENYRRFSREVQELGDDKRPLADAVLSHRCRLFEAGTIFIFEKAEGQVLVRVHVKGDHASFWTSRLFLN